MNKKRVDTTTGYLTKGKEFRCNFDSTMLEFFDSDTLALLQSAAHELIVIIIKIEYSKFLRMSERKNMLIECLSILEHFVKTKSLVNATFGSGKKSC